MRTLSLTLVLLARAAALDAPDAAKAGMDPGRLARIGARMQAYVDRGASAGYVTLVARHGAVAYLNACGWLDREDKLPMRTDSLFQIKSMTKPVPCRWWTKAGWSRRTCQSSAA